MKVRGGACLLLLGALLLPRRATAENHAQGQLVVDGKTVKICDVYALPRRASSTRRNRTSSS
jgi:hypothetical protein